MNVLPLEKTIIYGPVHSRRLGLSLGVNLLPTRYKLCSFDCVYCHYGHTHIRTLTPEPRDLPWPQEVLRAVEVALRRYPHVEHLTFSGNGEPTLHPAFPEIAAAVRALRDALAPTVKLALFSNATTVHREPVRQALALFDAPILKLDAGDPATLAAVNRPAPEARWSDIIAGLQAVPAPIVQSVLIDGPISNARGAAFETWLAALVEIAPARVLIYSTDYPVPERGIERIPPYALRRIAEEAQARTGLPIEVYWARKDGGR